MVIRGVCAARWPQPLPDEVWPSDANRKRFLAALKEAELAVGEQREEVQGRLDRRVAGFIDREVEQCRPDRKVEQKH